jgi:rhodanese-related sulfurtransferase
MEVYQMYLKKIGMVLILMFACTLAQAQVKPAKQIVTEAKSNIIQISVDELKKKIESKEKFILVDVRTDEEYLAGHIEGSVLIPRGELEFDIQKLTNDPEVEIVLYCRAGGRSALAVRALNNIGYEKVLNLDGGFKKWVTEGNSAFNMHGEIKVINFEKEEKKYQNINSLIERK